MAVGPQPVEVYGQCVAVMKVLREVGYKVEDAFDMFDDCTAVYEGALVGVAAAARGRGLVAELVRRSMRLAEEKGCEYTYILATGEYSARVFAKLGFTVAKEHRYADIRLDNGEEMLRDTREHTTARVVYKKLEPTNKI